MWIAVAHHFSALRAAVGLLFSGALYLLSGSSVGGLAGGEGSEKGCMNSTPAIFHSPAASTNTEERLRLWCTRLQLSLRKLMDFCRWTGRNLMGQRFVILLGCPSHSKVTVMLGNSHSLLHAKHYFLPLLFNLHTHHEYPHLPVCTHNHNIL